MSLSTFHFTAFRWANSGTQPGTIISGSPTSVTASMIILAAGIQKHAAVHDGFLQVESASALPPAEVAVWHSHMQKG